MLVPEAESKSEFRENSVQGNEEKGTKTSKERRAVKGV